MISFRLLMLDPDPEWAGIEMENCMPKKSKSERLYFTAFSDVVKPRSEVAGSLEEAARLRRLPDRKGVFAEALLFSDEVVLDVGGPNLPLLLLLKLFGYKTLRQLIEEDVIRFSFCPGSFAYLSKENMQAFGMVGNPGLHRLIAAGLAWSDPYESAEFALREGTHLNREERRRLSMSASRNTIVLPAERMFAEAIRLANADKASTLGMELGFIAEDDPAHIDFPKQKKLQYLDLAHHNLSYLSMALGKCDDIVAEPLAYRVLENRVIVQPQFTDKLKVSHDILELENLPDIRQLVSQGHLSLTSILKIRKSKHLREFRSWIKSTPSKADTMEIIKAYRSAVDDKLSNKVSFKILKIGFFTVAGAAIGAVAGPVGAGVGAIATDVLLRFTDTFFVDNLVDGWNPKVFIDKEIKSRLSE